MTGVNCDSMSIGILMFFNTLSTSWLQIKHLTRSATHVNTPEKKKDVPSWMLTLFVLLCPSMPQIII